MIFYITLQPNNYLFKAYKNQNLQTNIYQVNLMIILVFISIRKTIIERQLKVYFQNKEDKTNAANITI